jgi:hypothetical protein
MLKKLAWTINLQLLYFFFFSFGIFFSFIVLAGVHCDIYKGSYNISNISYLNLPPPPFFFIPSALVNVFLSENTVEIGVVY